MAKEDLQADNIVPKGVNGTAHLHVVEQPQLDDSIPKEDLNESPQSQVRD